MELDIAMSVTGSIDVAVWENNLEVAPAGINSILLFLVPMGMEVSQACLLLLFAFVALCYILAPPESKVEFKGPPHAFKMSSLSTTCKVD
jgi:hypothetical protein